MLPFSEPIPRISPEVADRALDQIMAEKGPMTKTSAMDALGKAFAENLSTITNEAAMAAEEDTIPQVKTMAELEEDYPILTDDAYTVKYHIRSADPAGSQVEPLPSWWRSKTAHVEATALSTVLGGLKLVPFRSLGELATVMSAHYYDLLNKHPQVLVSGVQRLLKLAGRSTDESKSAYMACHLAACLALAATISGANCP